MGFDRRLRSSGPIAGAGEPAAIPGSACAGAAGAEAIGERIARFERAGPHLYGALEQRAGLRRFAAMRENRGELEVGVEIVRVGGQFFAEGLRWRHRRRR